MAEYHNLESAAQQLQRRVIFLQRLGLGLDVLLGGVLAAVAGAVASRFQSSALRRRVAREPI